MVGAAQPPYLCSVFKVAEDFNFSSLTKILGPSKL